MVAQLPRKGKEEMKLPTARKLPSGNWTVRVQIGGQIVSVTRPTKKECMAEAALLKTGNAAPCGRRILQQAIEAYIDARRNVLSPSTIRGYTMISRNRFQPIMRNDITHMTQEQWQMAVNREAKEVSAKTLANAWGLIQAAVMEATGQKITVRLPQIIRKEKQWLTPEQIPVFLNAIRGKKCEIPALLALSSLRRSEIVALRWCDIDMENSSLRVCGASVPDESGKIVRKEETKSVSSRRTVPIIPPLADALGRTERHGEFVAQFHPSTIANQINKVCRSAGLPEVGLHGLRHSFASLAYHLGVPELVTMQIGGWSNNQTVRTIYTHISKSEVQKNSEQISDFFAKL